MQAEPRRKHNLKFVFPNFKLCVSEWLTFRTYSKRTTLPDIRTPWWWHSRSAETCRTICIYCVHISVHVRLVWKFEFCVIHFRYNIKIVLNCVYHAGLIARCTSLKLRKRVSPKRLCLCRLIPDYVTLRHFLDDSNFKFHASNVLKFLYLLVQPKDGVR